MALIAADVATAFNTASIRKTWTARHNSRSDSGRETVHFTTPQNLVTIVYVCETNKFAVRFNKFHAAWGDYMYSIANALYVVLTTLKAAGLPFEAPDDVDGIEIIATVARGQMTDTYVRWEPPVEPSDPFAFVLGLPTFTLADALPQAQDAPADDAEGDTPAADTPDETDA
jgi:hypothetical protein